MKQTDTYLLGQMLREARKRKGLTLRAVQEATGIPFTWITRTEHGHYSRPSPERLTKLAEVLGIDIRAMDGATNGEMSGQFPKPSTYFRAKYQLSQEEITHVEDVISKLREERTPWDAEQP